MGSRSLLNRPGEQHGLMSSEKSGLPPTPTTTPRMSGSSERPARRLHRSNSEDRNMTSSDSGNADTLKVMSNSLQLAQTRARKAEEVVKEYDVYLDGFIEDAVEWAKMRDPPIRLEVPGEAREATPAASGGMFQVFKGIGKYTGVLQDSAEGFGDVSSLDDEDVSEGAKATIQVEKLLQRTLAGRAASKAGPSGISAASKLSRSGQKSRSEEWTES